MHTITLASDLPTITQGVRIDGYSQPGSAANTRIDGDNATRCIHLNGAGVRNIGLRYSGQLASQFWLQGLAIGGFTTGLAVENGTDALVWGNQFGGAFGPLSLVPNGTAILLTAISSSASIGGSNPAQRNVIASASTAGISIGSVSIFSSTGNEIVGNLIGTFGPTESNIAGNQTGIRIGTNGNTVRDNVIVNSTTDGVRIEGSAQLNTIEGNRIGRNDTFCSGGPIPICTQAEAPNGRYGVSLFDTAHDNRIADNEIWNNGLTGVLVGGTGKHNTLSENSIFHNTEYGILLVGVGGNNNDADPDEQNLANRGLNYPDIVRVYGGSDHGWIDGVLNSTNSSYLIEVFSSRAPDNELFGEGETFHGISGTSPVVAISNAPSGQNGSISFHLGRINRIGSALTGRWFTLTATDIDGNTSEHSYPVQYVCDVIFANGVDDGESNACPAP